MREQEQRVRGEGRRSGKGKEKAGVRKTAGMRKDDCVKKIEGDWGGGEKKGSIMGRGEKIGMARIGKGEGARTAG